MQNVGFLMTRSNDFCSKLRVCQEMPLNDGAIEMRNSVDPYQKHPDQVVVVSGFYIPPTAKVILRCDLVPVVQSIVSLTMSLRRQLVKFMWTTLPNALLFFVGKMSKDSHIFSTKNNHIFVIFTFKILMIR